MSKIKIKKAVIKAKPLIDKLLETFLSKGWEYLPHDKHAKVSRYDFVSSNLLYPRLSIDRLDTDILGSYRVPDVDYHEPGSRILFVPTIIRAAELLQKQLPDLLLKDITDSLTAIVALHETIHWVMHTFKTQTDHRLIDKAMFDDSSLCFDEGLAQLFTYKIISREPKIMEVFNELCKHQSNQYNVFRACENIDLNLILDELSNPVILYTQSWELFLKSVLNSNKELAFKKYIEQTNSDATFERFKEALKYYQSDLYDGFHNTGSFRGRITAKKFGM
jgi:hypothetical protein